MIDEIQNAVIEKVSIGYEHHGILTAYVFLKYGGSVAQAFGGFGLGGGDYCARFIKGVLDTVGVERWEELPGKSVRVKSEHTKVNAIGHFLEDKWFNPSEEFKDAV